MNTTHRRIVDASNSSEREFVAGLVDELSRRFSAWIVTPQQLEAWETGLGWIWEACQGLPTSAGGWLILPEYVPPLSSIRPDLVIATGERAFVIEQKTGGQKVGRSAEVQLERYAREIWGSVGIARRGALYPVLMTSGASDGPPARLESPWTSSGGQLNVLVPSQLGEILAEVALKDHSVPPLEAWTEAKYDLHPSIVEAATALIAHVEDRNVLTHVADDEELNRVREVLLDCVSQAKRDGKRVVVMVTGVPGSGKTLVGLRLAHDPDLQAALPAGSGTPLYLTGNGPLVQVLVEAIARDHHSRYPEEGMAQSRAWAGSKVKLVRAITADDFPVDSHVVVFDEGQRIWTAEQMRLKHGKDHNVSEAEAILATLEDRDWAVLVVLIGGGQEINRGEAGPATWMEAISTRTVSDFVWSGLVSSEVAVAGDSRAVQDPQLHLRVSRRASSAAALSEWVEMLLDGELTAAEALRTREFPLFPLVVTRDLEVAKKWVRDRVEHDAADGFRPTSGAFASSKNGRLRAYGLEVGSGSRDEIDWPKWFLDRAPSVHASELLEVAASEFKCQGLELDYALVGWSWDLVWIDQKWRPRRLNKSKASWHNLKLDAEYLINAYRVLLTRCRRGMVIWVPEGNAGDPSRDVAGMNEVFGALIAAGVMPLEEGPSPAGAPGLVPARTA